MAAKKTDAFRGLIDVVVEIPSGSEIGGCEGHRLALAVLEEDRDRWLVEQRA